MKHELIQVRDLTGLQLRNQNSMLCGYYRGFATVVNLNSRQRCYDVLVWAVRPGEDVAEEANRWVADYAAQHPVCTGGNYTGRMLAAHIAIDKKRDVTAQSLSSYLGDVTGWLASRGMSTCCESCGSADTAVYNLGGTIHAICPQCLARMSETAKAEQKAIPGNLPAGVVGALLFSLAGVALWVLVNRLGYIAAICGLVLVVCAFKGYEIFGKKIDMPAIVICLLVAVFMGLVSQYICIGMDIYEAFEEYGVSMLDALRSVPQFIFDPELELLAAYAPDLIISYVFMALGSFSFIRNAIAAQKYGGFAVEKLAERSAPVNSL